MKHRTAAFVFILFFSIAQASHADTEDNANKKNTKPLLDLIKEALNLPFKATEGVGSVFDLGNIFIHVGSFGTQDQSKIGKSLTVVKEVEEQGPQDITETIQEVQGVTVRRLGGQSALTTIRLRGARSIDTQVMYDGIELRDPSDPSGSADPFLGDLLTGGISDVEILRGASSSLYGSKAVGGVINLVPRQREGARLWGECGTFNTFSEGIDNGFKTKGFGDHYFSFDQMNSEGFHPQDRYEQSKFSGKSIFAVGEVHTLALDYLYSCVHARLDSAPFVQDGVLHLDSDDENDKREQDLWRLAAVWTGKPAEGLVYSVKTAYTDSDRRYTFLPNSDGSGFFSDGDFEGRDWIFNPSLSFAAGEHFVSTLGYTHEREWYLQRVFLDGVGLANQLDEHAQSHDDYYGEEVITYGGTTLTLAARENTNDFAKSRATFDVAISQFLSTHTLVKSHYGTSFRTPSLYELHGAFLSEFGKTSIGNPGLSPERGATFDVGFEQPLGKAQFGAAYFRTDILNKINFVYPSYVNIDSVDHTDGIESFAKYDFNENVSARASYTFTAGPRLYDVPRHKVTGSATANGGKYHGFLEGVYTGNREIQVFDNDFSEVDVLNEKSDIVFNAKVSYDINKTWSVYVRGENIFSESYTRSGYRTPGARVFGGAVATF